MLSLMTNHSVPTINPEYIQAIIKRINRKHWWHVMPIDPQAYKKRGKFYSSSFDEAEFYGHSGRSERVTVYRPLAGDEAHIEMVLFGYYRSGELVRVRSGAALIKARLALDARMKKAAVAAGYDCIALMTPRAWDEFLELGKLPKSVELNVLG